jgi:hypothetical protein
MGQGEAKTSGIVCYVREARKAFLPVQSIDRDHDARDPRDSVRVSLCEETCDHHRQRNGDACELERQESISFIVCVFQFHSRVPAALFHQLPTSKNGSGSAGQADPRHGRRGDVQALETICGEAGLGIACRPKFEVRGGEVGGPPSEKPWRRPSGKGRNGLEIATNPSPCRQDSLSRL